MFESFAEGSVNIAKGMSEGAVKMGTGLSGAMTRPLKGLKR